MALPSQGSAQRLNPVRSAVVESVDPRQYPAPKRHQSGRTAELVPMLIWASIPTNSVTLAGGAKEATSENGVPVFESHVKNVFEAPVVPQSSQDRLMPDAGLPVP